MLIAFCAWNTILCAQPFSGLSDFGMRHDSRYGTAHL